MADPISLGIGGAAVGAMMDGENPMRGAALGGLGGFGGGHMLGLGAANGAAGAANIGAASNMGPAAALAAAEGGYGGSLGSLGLAGGYGTPGLLGGIENNIGLAKNVIGNKVGGFMANPAATMTDPQNMMQAGMMMQPQQPPPQQAPAAAPMMAKQAEGRRVASTAPYQPGPPIEAYQTSGQPMYGFNRYGPF